MIPPSKSELSEVPGTCDRRIWRASSAANTLACLGGPSGNNPGVISQVAILREGGLANHRTRPKAIKSAFSTVLKTAVIFAPWPLRRRLLKLLFGYDLHPTSRIGKSWVYPKQLVLKEYASIGHLKKR